MTDTNRLVIKGKVAFRKPTKADATAVHALIDACKPLDTNSVYCNLLQCDHFADSCVLAERDGEICGWISGYIPPAKQDTLFVWQVAVAQHARGERLADRMLGQLLDRDICADVEVLETTITPDNTASWALFKAFARRRGALINDAPYYLSAPHFNGAHKTEHLVTITLPAAQKRAA